MWLELVIRIYQISIIDAFFLKISFLSSLLVLLGRGLFAARDFSAGELITVSPILTLPSERVEETYEDSVLVNFCYTCGAEVLSFFISLFLYFFPSFLLRTAYFLSSYFQVCVFIMQTRKLDDKKKEWFG